MTTPPVVRTAARAVLQEISLRDCFFFGGLALAGAGGAQLSPPWTLIGVGAVLVLKASWPARGAP